MTGRFPRIRTIWVLLLPSLLGLGGLFEVTAFCLPTPTTAVRRDKAPRRACLRRASPRPVDASTSRRPKDLVQLKIIFTDVDGALIHYPPPPHQDDDDVATATTTTAEAADNILALPPSATGMKGIISHDTLRRCRDLRKAHGLQLVLVSGMRTSTLLNRLPYLPRADAYCTEAGGRIFYPTAVEVEGDEGDAKFPQQWTPVAFHGARPEDLQPFGLREDRSWRKRMELEQAAGKDGYAGNEVSSDRLCDEDDDDEECLIDYDNPSGFPKQQDVIPLSQRKGALWEFARELQDTHGFVLDTKSYSTCFRVNRKHQTHGPAGENLFENLLTGEIAIPPELGISTNLGCIDIYPMSSGKRNW
jgi:hypothetical protein